MQAPGDAGDAPGAPRGFAAEPEPGPGHPEDGHITQGFMDFYEIGMGFVWSIMWFNGI